MKPDDQSLPLLHALHERVFAAPEVRAMLDAGFARLAEELRSRPDPPHATCTVPIELFVGAAPVVPTAPRRGGEREGDPDPRSTANTEGAPEEAPVRLCRLFLLRRGARMAVPERHRNSVQHLVSYQGSGSIHQGVPDGGVPGRGPEALRPRAITSPGAKGPAHRDCTVADITGLGRHWDIVPEGVWHFPEAAEDRDWATVTFHSAAEDEIVDERWLGDAPVRSGRNDAATN